MLLTIRVKPKAKQPSVTEDADGGLIVAVREAPEDGKANAAVITALARHFDVPRSSVTIVRGLTGRKKVVRVGE